jgi:pimeloyl-ACP methyl ester carboxylesterase
MTPRCNVVHYGAILTVVLAGAFFAGPWMASAETIRFEDMRNGTQVNASQCSIHRQSVYVTVFGQGYCIRYYESTSGGQGRRPVVYLPGDRPGIVKGSPRYDDPKFKRDDDTRRMTRDASRISEAAGTTAIYLARIGVGGSSGHHSQRRTMAELRAYSSALDVLKERYKFEGFDLIGQSGGSTLIAAMLASRTDIRCAVLGSGLLAGKRRRPRSTDPSQQPFHPEDGIAAVAKKRNARIIVITEPNDVTVPRDNQDPFVQKVRAAGGNVQQYYVRLAGARRHGVQVYSFYAVGACAQGVDDRQIASGLKKIEERVIAKAERRQRSNKGQDDDD